MRLFLNELSRSWILYRRYPADVLSGLALLLITFFALLMGAQYIAGPSAQMGERVDSVILGYWLWSLTIFALSNTATMVQGESIAGTLEQVYMAPHSPVRVFVTRAAASMGINVATSLVLLGILLLLTGRRLDFPILLVVPLATVVLSAYGLGLALGGLALVFKRVGRVVNLSQFFLLFLVFVPVEEQAGIAASLLPIAPGAALLRELMARQQGLDPALTAGAVVGGLLYFGIGTLLFRTADRAARKRGLLAQY